MELYMHVQSSILFPQGSFCSTAVRVSHVLPLSCSFLYPLSVKVVIPSPGDICFSSDCDKSILCTVLLPNGCLSVISVGVASMRAGTGRGNTAGARIHPPHTHTRTQIHSLRLPVVGLRSEPVCSAAPMSTSVTQLILLL